MKGAERTWWLWSSVPWEAACIGLGNSELSSIWPVPPAGTFPLRWLQVFSLAAPVHGAYWSRELGQGLPLCGQQGPGLAVSGDLALVCNARMSGVVWSPEPDYDISLFAFGNNLESMKKSKQTLHHCIWMKLKKANQSSLPSWARCEQTQTLPSPGYWKNLCLASIVHKSCRNKIIFDISLSNKIKSTWIQKLFEEKNPHAARKASLKTAQLGLQFIDCVVGI